MPTYEYACRECGRHTEAVQSFTDDPLTTCPTCGGPLRKVFGNIGIAFKGSGFYKNDSRSSSSSAKTGTSSSTGDAGASSTASPSTPDSGGGAAAPSTSTGSSGDAGSAKPAAAAS